MTRKWWFNEISIRFTTLRTWQCKGISVAKFITVGHWSCYPACLAGLNHLGPNTQGAYMSYIHLTLFVGFSYGHLLVITGYKWDYTIYKWGFLSTYNWYFGP